MKTNKLILSFVALSACVSIAAQTTFDAAKVYEEDLNGTARYVAMGGAMSALGSDPSVISHNPAGIGTYHNSDLNTSLSFFGTSVNTDPLYTSYNQGVGNTGDNARYFYSNNIKSDINVAYDNLSVIFSGSDQGRNYVNFGFSYRKLLNTDRNLDYLDKYFIKDEHNPEQKYVAYREYGDHQRNKVNSYDFNISCNLSDMLYLGWTFGILSTDTWSEGYFYDYFPSFDQATIADRDYIVPEYYDKQHDYSSADKMNSAQGTGWNMAFGAIVRPVPALRLGVAIKTPTYFKQELVYEDCLYALKDVQKDGKSFSTSTEYKFTSPWSLNLSAGLTIDHTAIGLEYEKHFTQRSSLSVGNTRLASQGAVDFRDYSTFKMGIEQNIGNLSLRAGYNFTESMFNDKKGFTFSDTDFNDSRMDFQIDRLGKSRYFTAGLGYCSAPDYDGTQFYFDLAYVHGVKNSVLNVNEYDEDVDVNYNYKSDKVMFTIGWNF